jgi:hypothetical protein
MTEGEFLSLHTTTAGGSINTPYTINVNYDDSVVGVPGLGRTNQVPNYIIGITVTRNAKSVNDVPNVDLAVILDGIDKIRFTFDGFDYALDVITRGFYTGQSGTITRGNAAYFYFRTVPFQISATALSGLTDPETQLDTLIDFAPFIDDLEYIFADYNAILNNALATRRSYKIEKSDRRQDTAVPSNFQAIYNRTAEPAEVQDSLYYDTGWINARYNGTKTTADNYSGLVPSISGREFRGEVFNGNTDYDTFCLLRNDSRQFEPLFHSGPRNQPDYETTGMGIYLEALLPTNVQIINYASGSYITGSIDRGDILVIQNEKVKVLSVNTLTTPPYIRVTRGYVGTTDASHIAGTEIFKVDRTDLFRFTNSRSKTRVLDNNVVYTETTNIALHTDIYGTVYSQSICPQTLLLGIDDPNPIP